MMQHLDISIGNAEKFADQFNKLAITSPAVIEEKVDGTKLTLIRNGEVWNEDATKNWIVAYKTRIIYPEEFDGLLERNDISGKSIGTSQYKFVWDHLKSVHKNSQAVKPNTELFIEYVMRKPTLTRKYKKLHQLVIISSSRTEFEVRGGRVFSKPTKFNTDMNSTYASSLCLCQPQVMFRGMIKGPNAVDTVKLLISDAESAFGGKVEGAVITFNTGDIFKIVQGDQYDPRVRREIKEGTEPLDRAAYWNNVRQISEHWVSRLDTSKPIQQNLSILSVGIYNLPDPEFDTCRNGIITLDDIFLTAKDILIRNTRGNNGALFSGRFSPLTIAHYNIINDALKKYDTVTVNLVKGARNSNNPFSIEVQKEMINACFGDLVELTESRTGNIETVLQKSTNVINVVLCGTDRLMNYSGQMKHDHNVKVVEIPRTNKVSGSLVRGYLRAGDRVSFIKNVPSPVADMYDKLKTSADLYNE